MDSPILDSIYRARQVYSHFLIDGPIYQVTVLVWIYNIHCYYWFCCVTANKLLSIHLFLLLYFCFRASISTLASTDAYRQLELFLL